MRGFPFSQEGGVPEDAILERNGSGCYALDPSIDAYFFVVVRSSLVSALRLGNGKKQMHLLQLGIGGVLNTAIFRPPCLKPFKVSTVVSHPHLIRLGVSHPYMERDNHGWMQWLLARFGHGFILFQ
jgi:hypothetical protein